MTQDTSSVLQPPFLHLTKGTSGVDLFLDEASLIAVDIAGRDVSEHLKTLDLPCQLEHPERSANVAVHSIIKTGIKVNGSSTVDDDLAG